MSESESMYRMKFGIKIRDAMIKSKAEAGREIERVVVYTENDELDEDEYYAALFNEVSKIMGAFALELTASMR